MCEDLMDIETYARVKVLSPKPTETPPVLARMILKIMQAFSLDEYQRAGMDDRKYWQVELREFWEQMSPATPRKIGSTCRAMGLKLWRVRRGYLVAWNRNQLEILKEYFHVE
jgi:hypothetical protein